MSEPKGASAGSFKRNARAIVASLALLLAFAWILHAGALPVVPKASVFASVDPWGVAWMALLLIISILLRLGRYHYLIAPIGHVPLGRIMSISCVAFGLLTFLPFRLGEVARPAMLREKGKISGWAVTGTVAAERIIDGVVFSAALLVGLWFAVPHEPLPDHIGDLPVPAVYVPRAAQIAALGFGGAFLVMIAFYYWRTLARRITERVLGVFSQGFASKVAEAVERVSEGMRFLPDIKNSGIFLVITLVALFSHAYSIVVLSEAVGLPPLSLAEAMVVLGVLGLGFALPNAPGFFGAFQLALYAGLAVYLPPERVVREGAAFVFLLYVVYLAQVILLTVWGVIAEYRASARESETPPSRSAQAM